MCEKYEERREQGRKYVEELFDWLDSKDKISMPDGLTEVVVRSADMASRAAAANAPSVEATTAVGLMVVETCRIAYLAGIRAARQEREAPNGEGEMAPVQMVPIERPVSKS